jgi:mannose-1-phosphate guanylyltransferase
MSPSGDGRNNPHVKHRLNTWSLVLAGGAGSRLQGLTRNHHGVVVPKQFCSLQGGPSLLQEALQRAAAVAPMQRVCTVVAEQHRVWWREMLSYLPEENIVVQPHNRGTAHGILLPLVKIAERDLDATVVVLPADHHLSDEDVLVQALREVALLASTNRDAIYLLGMQPDEPDTELGYILPAQRASNRPVGVLRFIEKPAVARAQSLLQQGALWNAFIIAGTARAFLRLFDARFDGTVETMRTAPAPMIESLYVRLPEVDFSRDVLQGNESVLQVMAVPNCGWTDLGTPKRVGATLERILQAETTSPHRPYVAPHLNLAHQYDRLSTLLCSNANDVLKCKDYTEASRIG